MRLLEHQVIQVAGSNTEMENAIDQARSSVSDFFRAFENPKPNQSSFLIKARFTDGDYSEHIWLANLNFKTRPATGVVANEPEIESLRYMERVTFLPDQITDWMYMEDGELIGGYTTKVLMRAKFGDEGSRTVLKQRRLM